VVSQLAWLLAVTAADAQEPQDQPAPAGAEAGQDPAVAANAEPAIGRPAPENWFETRVLIEDLMDAGDFAAAEALGPRLLELAEQEFGPESVGLAEAHLFLANTQKDAGNFRAAETNIMAAIDIYVSREGPLSPVLIDPFLNLGENYDEAGDYANAISAYGEARTIGRRNFGLLNTDQIEIIDVMTAAAERLGQLEEARELQLEALTLIERNHDENSIEAIDARYKFASWLREQRLFDEERRMYSEILRIIERHHDEDPLLTARALRARAMSFREQDNAEGTGLSGLRNAVESLVELPEPPALLIAELYLEIGDWNVEFSRTGALGDDYTLAWSWLGSLPNGDELRREWFEPLTVVEIDPVSSRGLSTDPDAPRGYVEIYFTVDRSGRARDIEITDSYPPGFKDGAFLRQYQRGRFRPRVEDGEIVSVRRARRAEFGFNPEAAGLSAE
jgi:tetratricopeptide (TPR) repeat protein